MAGMILEDEELISEKRHWGVTILKILIVGLTIFFALFSVLSNEDSFYEIFHESDVSYEEQSYMWEVAGDCTVIQEFTAPDEKVAAIDVLFGVMDDTAKEGVIDFVLYDEDNEELCREQVSVEELKDSTYYGFDVKNLLEPGNVYSYEISATECSTGDGAYVYVAECKKSAGILTYAGKESGYCVHYRYEIPELNEEAMANILLVVAIIIILFFPLKFDEEMSKVLGIAGLFIYPLISFYLVESLFRNPSEMGGRVVIFNYLIYLAVYGLLYLLLGRCRRAIVVGNIVAMIFGVVNFYVLEFRGTPLCPWDLMSLQTATEVVNEYKFEINPVMLKNVLGMVLVSVVLFHVKSCKESGVARMASGICICTFSLVVYMMVGSDFLVSQGIKMDLWRQRASYINNGFFLSFMMNTKYIDVEPPEGYSIEAAEEILKEYEDYKQEEPVIEEKPNIIMIMNEAYADLSVVGDFDTTTEYAPFVNSLTENTVKGNLYVSIFGGGTCNSEYEVLTGNSMANLAPGCIAYQQYISTAYETGNLTDALEEQGYDCYAIHPMKATNWNRENVYSSMGFKDFFDITDFEDKALVRKKYTSDEATYNKVIDMYEQKGDNPLFLFDVTVQNHGGYSSGWEFEEPVQIQGMSQEYPRTEEYLALHKMSDSAFEQLIEYFEKVEEPTMIVMFGDHHPAIEDKFYEELYGKTLEELELEEAQQRYAVPFIIWTNYDIEEEEVPAMSANYLSVEVLKHAGLKLPEYYAFLDDMKKQLPIYNVNGIMDTKGNYYYHWESHPYKELTSKYKIVQYNNAIDRKNALRSMYTMD